MRAALDDLELEHLVVAYQGDEAYPHVEQVPVLPVADIPVSTRPPGMGRGAPSPGAAA